MTQPVPPTWLDAYFRSGYVQIRVNGVLQPIETILAFQGTVVSGSDDPVNGQTIITISGSGGGGTLIVEANGSAITQRAILDLIGFTYVDDSGGGRMRFFAATGTPLVASGGVGTITTSQPWALINPGETWTFPASPIVGQTLEFTPIAQIVASNPVTFNGNGHNVCDPQSPYTNAATVTGRTDQITYRFRFDGALFRCVN